MPPLHSPCVPAIVPSVSMIASCKKPRGCCCQTRWRTVLMTSINSTIAASSKRRVKSPLVVGSGMRCAPKLSRNASSLRRSSMSSSRTPSSNAL